MIPGLEGPVFCYVERISMVYILKKRFAFVKNNLYTMQLSMQNFLLQYDGFHNLHFTTCGQMQADRNNSSSLEPSNLLSDTRCPCSHDWRKYMNQHHCHMHSSSVCSLHKYWARYCSIETPSSNLPAVSPQNSGLQTFITVADFGKWIL